MAQFLSEYDYILPESAIAQTPLDDRAGSKLLHLDRYTAQITHHNFREVLKLLQKGDLLILNDTRVSALRLMGSKPTGGQVEALLLEELEPNLYRCLAKPGRRLRPGSEILFEGDLRASIVGEENGLKRILFEGENVKGKLAEIGETPLPPYIHEKLEQKERYQTVYGNREGSAAAPTAGLHFTEEILDELKQQGVRIECVTLHVGLDTFKPVQAENLDEHQMHGEVCEVPEQTAEAVETCEGRIIAVGTTTVRTLETMAIGKRKLKSGRTTSRLFIRPGYSFNVIDGMFTNFHLPKTTMLMMISALISREIVLETYAEALRNEYRFLSFGDSMLIL